MSPKQYSSWVSSLYVVSTYYKVYHGLLISVWSHPQKVKGSISVWSHPQKVKGSISVWSHPQKVKGSIHTIVMYNANIKHKREKRD